MKNQAIAIMACSILLCAGELAYILSSPLVGEGDVARMADPRGVSIMGHESPSLEGAAADGYSLMYRMRPHQRDTRRGIFVLAISGLAVMDNERFGVNLWKSGVFSNCEAVDANVSTREALEFWEKARPSGAASQLVPLYDMSTAGVKDLLDAGGWSGRRGKRMPALGLGWVRLGDLIGSNTQVLFEDSCGRSNNVSGDAFLKDYARAYGVILGRSAFAESSLDGGRPWEGILYLAHYSSYNKTWLVMYGVDEPAVAKAQVSIDGVSTRAEVEYPFVFVDGALSDGEHTLVLSTGGMGYPLDFKVDTAPLKIEPAVTAILRNGTLSLLLWSTDSNLRLESVRATLGDKTLEARPSRSLMPYNATEVRIDFGMPLIQGDSSKIQLDVSYDVQGADRALNKTLFLMAE